MIKNWKKHTFENLIRKHPSNFLDKEPRFIYLIVDWFSVDQYLVPVLFSAAGDGLETLRHVFSVALNIVGPCVKVLCLCAATPTVGTSVGLHSSKSDNMGWRLNSRSSVMREGGGRGGFCSHSWWMWSSSSFKWQSEQSENNVFFRCLMKPRQQR